LDGVAEGARLRLPGEHTFDTLVSLLSDDDRRMRRALLSDNLAIIEATARQVQRVGLDDALSILVLLAKTGDPRYERAAARWAARVASEKRLGLAESRRVLALVDVLPEAPAAVKAQLLRYVR